MLWELTHQKDPRVAALADRHYSRKTKGSIMFSPPGRKLVLFFPGAAWVTLWQLPEYSDSEWARRGAMICTLFRNETQVLSSQLIIEAVAATRWKFPALPPEGMITFVAGAKVRSSNPGYCFLCAGFERVGETKSGLVVLQLKADRFPEPRMPKHAQKPLFGDETPKPTPSIAV